MTLAKKTPGSARMLGARHNGSSPFADDDDDDDDGNDDDDVDHDHDHDNDYDDDAYAYPTAQSDTTMTQYAP